MVLVSAGLISVNAMHVGNFGERNIGSAIIKVIAILVFIVVGAALISGIPLGTRYRLGAI